MTPLVFLPGMMCDARLFAPQIAAFSVDRAVQVAPIGGADNVADLAAEVLAHAPPRFALAGLSMGGIVAMEAFRQAPDRIDRIAFLDTNPKAEADAVAKGREPQIARAKAGELRTIMRDEMKPRYLADGPNRAAILDLCMDMADALGPEVFVRQSHALQTRPDQQDTLRQIEVPTLALCGREDTLCPIHRHELICSLVSSATLEIIDGAGHLPTLEQPDATNAALNRWLEIS
ncbi:pimeloyl-ACP methyl ester carboxylesterase [Litoreibacter halocynthiae]|uniref:Pimeloyl-ACP methyl ester carboxylesterase n=1 Tax=Litoreibacter halocynthiae TaxID=1242689 RepID=A0A4R7LL06_9RHOB|nr:alpha/beta fold hydrolase [Litoreibacter halocynthiae]TDT74780.1 pimeloyl-ACP methyl ester carboxylesterase [Litoreibacter halocynthiae]